MCKHALHHLLVSLPKCEHHIHIEGSLSPSLLFRLAARNNISLPSSTDAAFDSPEALGARYANWASLDDFLAYYYLGMSVLLMPSDFEELAWAYFVKAASHNVRHAEVSFDVQAHTSRGVAYETVVEGLMRARRRAETELGISVMYIMCILRHLPVPESKALFEHAKLAGHFNDGTLAGIGMDSSEMPFPPEMFVDIYDSARAAGIRRTAHAGEEGPPAYVVSALDRLKVQRIDHGLRAVEDAATLERLAEEGLMLTLCPISNVQLKSVPTMADMPVRKMLDAGVKFSINSDDPAYFGGYIQEAYCAVQEVFELSVEEWKSVALTAVEGSWCDEDRKAELRAGVNEAFNRWE